MKTAPGELLIGYRIANKERVTESGGDASHQNKRGSGSSKDGESSVSHSHDSCDEECLLKKNLINNAIFA